MFEPSEHSAPTPPRGTVERARAGSTRVWELPDWGKWGHARRLDAISEIADIGAQDPRLRRLCVQVFREAGVQPRDYKGQQNALIHYLQAHVYFLNERDEVLQSVEYTLDLQPDGRVGPRAHGDCDDFASTLLALCRSMHIPGEPVISGRDKRGRLVRYIRGTGRPPRGVGFTHAYAVLAPHPFRGTRYGKDWSFGDATVPGVSLGWDCVGFGLSDPQRVRGGLAGLGDPGELVDGLTAKTILQLVLVSVASSFAVDALRWSVSHAVSPRGEWAT